MPNQSYSPINVTGLPVSADYHEYLQHAGSSGIGARYDEETGTLKIIFTETPVFHPLGSKPPKMEDLGTARFAFTVQQPEQLRILSKILNDYAQMMEWMQDPKYEYKDELMGRKPFEIEQE